MAQNPIASRLQTHLADLQANPTTVAIDSRLFEEADLVLPEQLSKPETFDFVQQLSSLLQTIQQNPAPAVNLLIRLLGPFAFSDVLAFDPPVDFATGLDVGFDAPEGVMLPFNRLMLALLDKASVSAGDAASVAAKPEVVLALVRLWLCSPDTGVATHASKVLLDLLRVDRELFDDLDQHVPTGGQGLVWKRVFGDRNVYGTLFEACGLKAKALKLSKKQRTLAQARLLEWLPAVASMSWSAVAKSHHADVEESFGLASGAGLLEFAALHMVDYVDDVLMYRCLIDFFAELLDVMLEKETPTPTVEASPALDYLTAKGLHERTTNIYLHSGEDSDIMGSMFLYGPSANYIATYASLYPKHFQASSMPKQVNDRLMNALTLSSSRWAHAESPKHDLHLLASLPRISVLPSAEGQAAWATSPLSLIPSKASNPDALYTLATIFHGPSKKIITFPPTSPLPDELSAQEELEAAAARALYMNYLANNPNFWNDITTHADTVALKDLALAAINCLHSVITANWSPKPSLTMPSAIIATPASGHLAILSPPALEYTLPYLIKPPQTFANLVGGRGDAESSAYKIAAAKWDALKALHGALITQVEQAPGQGFEDILATLSKRLAEGPLSREGEIGGRIDTIQL
ncbi:hypothetical protein WHR41_02104 [Cladosporium halotolerans]|uniref:Uncharacterized protein n=1 Tax=Cladosporium halotolerans TaxID=1052096 RepID=A0AB34KWF7_9PEZI